MSKDCIHVAADLLDNMDETVNPCEDFYHFACGGFIKQTNIPDDKLEHTAISVIMNKVDEQVDSKLSLFAENM